MRHLLYHNDNLKCTVGFHSQSLGDSVNTTHDSHLTIHNSRFQSQSLGDSVKTRTFRFRKLTWSP